MSQPKPEGLKTGAYTKKDREIGAQVEKSMQPDVDLPANAPSFFDFKVVKAEQVYKRLMKYYSQLDAVIVTSLDRDLIVNYCSMVSEMSELKILRRRLLGMYSSNPASTPIADITTIDARIDRKASLIHTLAQSLYLTPRARAGAIPEKKKEKVFDPFEEFLNELDVA